MCKIIFSTFLVNSFIISTVLAVVFAAYSNAAPQGDNYDELIDALEGTLPSVGPQAENYIDTLVANSNAQEQAQESGNRCQLAQILDKGAVDTAAGAYHLKSNPELYQLASVEAPSELAALADGVASGYYDNEDVYNAVGNFNQEVREATQQPLNS